MKRAIRRTAVFWLTAWLAALYFLASAIAAQNRPVPPPIAVKVGDSAPDFSLRSHEMKDVRLSDLKGKKNVVLAFYVLAFTGG